MMDIIACNGDCYIKWGRSCLINEVGKTFYLCLSGSFQICEDKEALSFPFRLTKSTRICNDESCLSAFFTIVCHVSSEMGPVFAI